MTWVNGSLSALPPLKSLWEQLPNPETSSSEMLIQRTDRRGPGLRGGRGEEHREGDGGAGEEADREKVLWEDEETVCLYLAGGVEVTNEELENSTQRREN